MLKTIFLMRRPSIETITLALLFCGGCDVKFQGTTTEIQSTGLEILADNGVAKSHPAWSPDGSFVAYTASAQAIVLRRFSFDSAETTVVDQIKADASLSKASFDLQRIAYVNREDGFLRVSDVAGGASELLASQSGISEIEWSGDNQWIAYVRNGKVWYIESHGGTPTRLAGSPVPDSGPTWSPDNLQIAFISTAGASGSSLWLGDLATNSSRLLLDSVNVTNPNWSPDGNSLAFEVTRQDSTSIWRFDLSTEMHLSRPPISIRLSDSTRIARMPLWSPDGERVAYFGDGNTVWVTSKSGEVISRSTFTHDYSNAFWHPDNQTLCFSGSNNVSNIEIFSLETRQITQITSIADGRNDAWPAWFPDGSRLAFSRTDAVSQWPRFYVASLADGSVNPMHTDDIYRAGPGYETNAAISPDGNWLIGDGLLSPIVYRLDGSSAISLSDYIQAPVAEPQWGPDSRSAVFTTPGGLSIIAVDSALDISTVDIQPLDNERYREPAWSPEYEDYGSYLAASGSRGIYVMRPDGSQQVPVVEDGESPAWNPLERRLAFIKHGNLYAMSVIHDVPQ
jgi:Tol biopolymer transport system component